MTSRVIRRPDVVGNPPPIPNPENPIYNETIEDGFSTRIMSPADLSTALKISRITEIPGGGGGGDPPIMQFYSLWGNHQCNVVSSFPDSGFGTNKSIDAWVQFTDIQHVEHHSSGYWCPDDFERFSNCEFAPQFTNSTLIDQIKHFFVQGKQPFDKGSIITGLRDAIHLGRQRFAEKLKPMLEKSRNCSDIQSRCNSMDLITDLFIEGQLKSTGPSIPIGNLSIIYITGDNDVYKTNGVVHNDPDFNQATFNFLFVFIISDPATGTKYTIHMNIDRATLRQLSPDNDNVSYWTGKFIDYTRTVEFLELVKEQLRNPIVPSLIPADQISVVLDVLNRLSMRPLGQVIRTNTAITIGCKDIAMLVHYTKDVVRDDIWSSPNLSKIIIPRHSLRSTLDGIVGVDPLSSVADQYSTPIFKLYPDFPVTTRTRTSQSFNTIRFKSLPQGSMGSFFFPPEYNSLWVDEILQIRQGDSQPCSQNATWGSLVHSSIEGGDVDMDGDVVEAGAGAAGAGAMAARARAAGAGAAGARAAEVAAKIADLNAAEARAAAEAEEMGPSAALVQQPTFGSFLKSIWRKFLDIIRMSSIGIHTKEPPNFFDSDDGADLNKMFIQFALEICDEIEQYIAETPEPSVEYYEFAARHAFNAASDLYQLCFPDVPIAGVSISMYTKNMEIATNLLSNVNEFINKSKQNVQFSCRLAIFSARAIAYIYSNIRTIIPLESIKLLARSTITCTTLTDFERIITENAKTEDQLVPDIHAFLYHHAEFPQGGGRRRVSRKRYKKILTCTRRRSARRRSSRVSRKRRRSRRSRRSIRPLIPV
jgi:hypothetical protein